MTNTPPQQQMRTLAAKTRNWIGLAAMCMLFAATAAAGAEQSKTLEQHTVVKADERVTIEGISGSDVRVHSWAKNEISVKLYVSVSSSDDAYEAEYTANTKLTEDRSDGTVRVRLDEYSGSPGFSLRNIFHGMYVSKNITGDVYVPESNPLTLDFKYGSMELTDMKAELNLNGTSDKITVKNCSDLRQVENPYGTTDISSSGGTLDLRASSSTVIVTDFTGPAKIEADYSTVTLRKISGEVTLEDKSGTVKVSDIRANVDLDANYSTVTATNITGRLGVQCTSGGVSVEMLTGPAAITADYSRIELLHWTNNDSGPCMITGKSGSLSIIDATTALHIDDPYSTITLHRVTGDIELASVSGNVKGETITGEFSATTSYTPITLRGLSAKHIMVTDVSSDVAITDLLVPTTVDIHDEYGGVRISMPVGFQGDVDMTADYGRIDTDLPVKVKTLESSAVALGKVGAGAGSISIETKSANISVLQGGN